jgi:hypothetical protein
VRQTGFIAQEVEGALQKTGGVFNGLETPYSDKDHYRLKYDEFVVPLVRALQLLAGKFDTNGKKIHDQKKQIEFLTDQINQIDLTEPANRNTH